MFKKNEKQYVEELVSIVTPGTSWLITGEHLMDMRKIHINLFAHSYQAITLPLEAKRYQNRFIIADLRNKFTTDNLAGQLLNDWLCLVDSFYKKSNVKEQGVRIQNCLKIVQDYQTVNFFSLMMLPELF